MNALADGIELGWRNGVVEKTVLAAYEALLAILHIAQTLSDFHVVQTSIKSSKIFYRIILSTLIVANMKEVLHTVAIALQSTSQLLSERIIIHFRACVSNNCGKARQERMFK